MHPMAEAPGLLPRRHCNPRLGLDICDTLTLDLWALCTSPRLSYPCLSYPSTKSRCHTECEIKALITLLGYDDVLLDKKGPQVMTIGALGKRLKSKVKNT